MLLLLRCSAAKFWDFLEILQRLDVNSVRQEKVTEGKFDAFEAHVKERELRVRGDLWSTNL